MFFNHVEQKASFLYKLSLQPYPHLVCLRGGGWEPTILKHKFIHLPIHAGSSVHSTNFNGMKPRGHQAPKTGLTTVTNGYFL